MKKLNCLVFSAFLAFTITINIQASFEPVPGITGKVTALLVNGNDIYAGIENNGTRLSTDNGSSWVNNTNNLGLITVKRFASLGNAVFAATYLGVYKTTDKGTSWQLMNNGLNSGVSTVRIFGNDIYAGTSAGQIYKSTNSGSSWFVLYSGMFNSTINDILIHNNNFFVASNYIFVTTNNGVNWSSENPPGGEIFVLHASGNVLRAGGSGGFKNTNPSGGWVYEQPWGNYTYGFAVVGNFIMHGGLVGIFWSSDNGVTWHDPGYPFLYTNNVYCMDQNGQYVFAGAQNGLYKKSTSSFTAISQVGNTIPKVFSLGQNYPNPFNPSTNIKVGLPGSSSVMLKVYNQLGQSVAELVNQKLAAGEYEYQFDAASLPSGIYYYKLTAGDYTSTRKMILIK